MFKQTILASGLILLSAAAIAGAKPLSETRGYDNCLSAAEDQTRNLVVEKTYFVNEQSKSRTYYLNALSVRKGAWAPARIACETSNSGNRLLTLKVETGRYAGKLASAAALAQN